MALLKFLVIEDERNLADSIRGMLLPLGTITLAYDGEEGYYQASKGVYDLIILDLMLPEMDGITLLTKIRSKGIQTPVLILSAKDSLEDKVLGFDRGADDYLTKPFHREELIMRIKALMKRTIGIEDNMVVDGDYTVNLNNHSMSYKNKVVPLQGKEFDLILYLIQNKNMIVTKEQIFDRIWGFNSDTSITVVEVYMSNLRKQLKKNDIPSHIRTLRNVGYIWESECP